jgi:hypothetical protein
MNHQERIELLNALSRAGVSYYKSHDLEMRFGAQTSQEAPKPKGGQDVLPPAEPDQSTEKLKDLIETLKMDDAYLVDKIFPAGAGL